MMRIRVNIFPKDGYRFKEQDGTLLVGDSWRGITARVVAYRKRNGLPPGDPAKEINDQRCQTNPESCFQDSGPQHAAAVRVTTLKSRVLQWFSRVREAGRRTPTEFASTELAQARANVCAGCPQNQSLPDGCSSCKAAVKELRVEVIGGRPADPRLVNHGCNVLGAESATQVWLEQVTVDNAELPAHCWRKRTI